VSPDAHVSRTLDPLDNPLWLARFPEPSDHLAFDLSCVVENTESNPFDFVLHDHATAFPFAYAPEIRFALGAYLPPPFDDTQARLQHWLDAHFDDRPDNTVELLSAFNRLIFERLAYERREERGIQPSVTTLERGRGACRDFAVLFVELCRSLGLAAR